MKTIDTTAQIILTYDETKFSERQAIDLASKNLIFKDVEGLSLEDLEIYDVESSTDDNDDDYRFDLEIFTGEKRTFNDCFKDYRDLTEAYYQHVTRAIKNFETDGKVRTVKATSHLSFITGESVATFDEKGFVIGVSVC